MIKVGHVFCLLPNRLAMIFLLYSAASSMRPLPRQYCGKIKKTSFKMKPMSFNSLSSKFSKTKTVIVVMMPTKRLAHARRTNATLGMLNTKLAGYISGIVANL